MNSNLRGGPVVLIAGALLFSGTAAAQQPSLDAAGIPTPRGAIAAADAAPAPIPSESGIPMGPLTVYPSVHYEIQRNDNIFLQAPNSVAVKSDTIQVLSPAVRVEGKQGPNTYSAGATGFFGRYNTSTADNYNSDLAFAKADLNPDTRVRARLSAEHVDAIDPRGSTNDPLLASPNRYRQDTLNGIFGYGAPGAQGRIEFMLGGLSKRYTNNRQSTAINDRDEATFGPTFYWRIAPRTSLLAEVRRTNVDFTDPSVTLDSTETRYFGGVTWEATAATTGAVRVGQVKKNFKNSTHADVSSPSWEAQITWSPLTYSRWEFLTSKTTRETTGNVGTSILTANYLARWNHAWTSQISTAVNGSYMTDDYQGISRSDKTGILGLRGTYQMRRWLGFGAGVEWSKRDSNVATAEYRKRLILLFVNAAI